MGTTEFKIPPSEQLTPERQQRILEQVAKRVQRENASVQRHCRYMRRVQRQDADYKAKHFPHRVRPVDCNFWQSLPREMSGSGIRRDQRSTSCRFSRNATTHIARNESQWANTPWINNESNRLRNTVYKNRDFISPRSVWGPEHLGRCNNRGRGRSLNESNQQKGILRFIKLALSMKGSTIKFIGTARMVFGLEEIWEIGMGTR